MEKSKDKISLSSIFPDLTVVGMPCSRKARQRVNLRTWQCLLRLNSFGEKGTEGMVAHQVFGATKASVSAFLLTSLRVIRIQ